MHTLPPWHLKPRQGLAASAGTSNLQWATLLIKHHWVPWQCEQLQTAVLMRKEAVTAVAEDLVPQAQSSGCCDHGTHQARPHKFRLRDSTARRNASVCNSDILFRPRLWAAVLPRSDP